MNKSLEQYIVKLKNGDSDAFNKIYELTFRKIYFVALPILRDKSLAEDIVQDTYLKFFEKLYSYKAKNSQAYLLTIARNLAINEYNRRKKITRNIDLDTKTFSYDNYLEISLANKELIVSALSILSINERNIFLLHNLEHLTHREISLIINKPLGTVTWTYQQAIKKMRKHLKGMM